MKSIRTEPHGYREEGDERIRTAVCDGTTDPAYETVTTDRAGYEQLVADRDRWKERSHELEAALSDLLANGGWGHNHWDSTRQFGAGCETCIQQREAKERARAALTSPEARP